MAYVKKDYIQSDAVTQAQQALQNQQANKPGQYQSQWQGQMNDLMGQIQNRPAFQYDVNADALYQQVAQNYIQQGKQAMMDTMGQAASMTGGYGNSYAQTVGQQQYNNHLLGLTEMVPQFQQMALQKYQMEGDDLLSRYGMLADLEDQEYGRYQDSLNQYLRELDRLQGIYDNERSFDYGKWADGEDFAYGQYRDDVADQQWKDSFTYQQSQDQKAYEQWLQEFQYQQEQDRIAQEQWQKEFEENQRRYNQEWAASQAKASGGSGGGRGGYGYDTHGMSTAEIKELQRELGVTADGIWGPKTEAAYQAKYGGSNVEVDMGSVLNLGYGPISGDTLSNLVASGAVNATTQGNKIVVSNNDTKKPDNFGNLFNSLNRLY